MNTGGGRDCPPYQANRPQAGGYDFNQLRVQIDLRHELDEVTRRNAKGDFSQIVIVRLVKIRVIGVCRLQRQRLVGLGFFELPITIHSSASVVELGVVAGLDEAAAHGLVINCSLASSALPVASCPPRATML